MEELDTVPREFRRALLLVISEQSADLIKTIDYFLKNRSVGEMLAVRELRGRGVKDPHIPIIKLIEIGFLERGTGCYNLSKEMRKWVLRAENKSCLMKKVLDELGIKVKNA